MNNSPPKKFAFEQKRLMPSGAPIYSPSNSIYRLAPSPTAGLSYRAAPLHSTSNPQALVGSVILEGGLISKKVHITVSISAEAFAAQARN